MKFFERTVCRPVKRHTLRRGIAIFFTMMFVILIFTVLLVALIPQLVNSGMLLVNNIDVYTSTLEGLIRQLNASASGVKIDISTITEGLTGFVQSFAADLPRNLSGIVDTSMNIGSSIFNVIIAVILAIYFLGDKEHLTGGVRKFLRIALSEGHYRDWADFWRRCNNILLSYIGGDLLDGLIIGLANFVFMIVTGMPYRALISVVVGVTNLAPTFGPIVGGVIGGFILVLVNPWYALWFIIFTIVLQTLDGYVIKPKLFGNTLGVSSVWILISIIVFGRIFGILGVLLAIPFAAIIDFVYREFFLIWLARIKGKELDTSAKK
jgi:predicted PurR-regulated permease PerM